MFILRFILTFVFLLAKAETCEKSSDFAHKMSMLREAPLYLHIDRTYFIKDGELPSTAASHRLNFDIYSTLSRVVEISDSLFGYIGLQVVMSTYLGPYFFLHESAHANRAKALFGLKSNFRWNKSTVRRGSQKFLLESFGAFFPLVNSAHTDIVHRTFSVADPAYESLQDWHKHVFDSQDILFQARNEKDKFGYLRQAGEISAAGINREIEQARFIAQRVLQGEPVRPELWLMHLKAVTGIATYPGGNTQGDKGSVEKYLRVLAIDNATSKANILSGVTGLLSGTTWAFFKALYNTSLVKPIWLFDCVLWPNFYAYYNNYGLSMLTETAVRVTNKAYLSCGFETLVFRGTDPFTQKKYSTYDVRVGAGFQPIQGLNISGYTLLNDFGGEFEASYYNPDIRLGLSVGAWWASDKTLCGERMADDKSWSKEGRNSFGFVRISLVL